MSNVRLALLAVAAAAAGAFGWFTYDRVQRADAAEAAAAEAQARAAAVAAGAKTVADAVAPAGGIPEVRPVFTLKDPQGKPRSITEWDGKSLMVNFWATWCAPCRREIPLLNRLQKEYAAQGVEVIGVAVDFPEEVVAYMQKTPIAYPVLIGEQDGLDAAQAFGVQTMAFPFTAFTDRRGRILTVHLGELHEPQARAILAIVARVNAGELDPPGARDEIRKALAALPKEPQTTS
jgi:thiol-disulfide isomerase/thioredoxin